MNIKEKAKKLKNLIPQLYIALKNKETPWYAKVLGGITLAYALSPIDFIPDFIPVLGYLDDIIILPILIKITIKMIPKEIWEKSELEAKEIWKDGKPKAWVFAILVILIWALIIYLVINAIFFK